MSSDEQDRRREIGHAPSMDLVLSRNGVNINRFDSVQGQRPAENSILSYFFPNYDVDPESFFADYVQLCLYEEGLSEDLRLFMKRRIRVGREPSSVVVAEVRKRQALLNVVRTARKGSGAEIFADEERDYANRICEVLTRQPLRAAVGPVQLAKHDAQIRALVGEVKEKFPESSQKSRR